MLKYHIQISIVYVLIMLWSSDNTMAFIGALTLGELFRMINSKSLFPIKEATSFLLVLQLLFAPFILYRYLDNQSFYAMSIDESTYFSFVIPATLVFNFLLYTSFNKENKFSPIKKDDRNLQIGIILFIAGFLASYLTPFIPGSLHFVIALIKNFPLIGVFYIFFSNYKYRVQIILLFTLMNALSIISGGVFINLFIFAFFVFSLFAYEYKFSFRIKTLSIIGAIFFAFLIQSFKQEYRDQIGNNKESDIGVFMDMSMSNIQEIDLLFSERNIKKFIDRINQGWILSDILKRVPKIVPIVDGKYFYRELEGIFLPRFLAPNKAVVGDHSKFLYATGRQLNNQTAMNIGFFGDGYVNFGFLGGIIFSGLFGLFINLSLKYAYKKAQLFPTLLFWLPLIFFYVMRAGNEFYIIANWMVKSAVLVALIFYYFRHQLRVK
ncbi:hypothetical protein [Carboxylicivirga sp. N1Y90]|uniref:hypothetical protein n=1 Tax=Carboxylicivirga fragile TaxID=3417571 RepID=UPI003D34677D|nr:hypothetical protein [Marinilabiliaceae bacterium N1Y90]